MNRVGRTNSESLSYVSELDLTAFLDRGAAESASHQADQGIDTGGEVDPADCGTSGRSVAESRENQRSPLLLGARRPHPFT